MARKKTNAPAKRQAQVQRLVIAPLPPSSSPTPASVKREVKKALAQRQPGQVITLSFGDMPGAGPSTSWAVEPENRMSLSLTIGVQRVVDLDVREHHAKSYSAAQKQKMLHTLDAMREVVTTLLLAKQSKIASFRTSKEEEK